MVDRNRKIVEHRMDADTTQLYGPIIKAAEYLQKMAIEHADKKDFHLDEYWPGYESMELVFNWTGPETDDQYNKRIRQEEFIEAQQQEEKQKEAKRKAFEKEQAALKRKYGVL